MEARSCRAPPPGRRATGRPVPASTAHRPRGAVCPRRVMPDGVLQQGDGPRVVGAVAGDRAEVGHRLGRHRRRVRRLGQDARRAIVRRGRSGPAGSRRTPARREPGPRPRRSPSASAIRSASVRVARPSSSSPPGLWMSASAEHQAGLDPQALRAGRVGHPDRGLERCHAGRHGTRGHGGRSRLGDRVDGGLVDRVDRRRRRASPARTADPGRGSRAHAPRRRDHAANWRSAASSSPASR